MKYIAIVVLVATLFFAGIQYARKNNGIHIINNNAVVISNEALVINWDATEAQVEEAIAAWKKHTRKS